jgi:CO/xanthine dehydrogenase FAD-binding subunit
MVSYYPKTLLEALHLKGEYINVKPYAGGSDLMVLNNEGISYLFLNQLSELKEIKEEEESIFIGAGLTYSELLESSIVPTILKEAISGIAAPAIRNVGTMGGNICNASPAGDTLPVLYALGASVKLLSESNKPRILPIDTFILGIRKTALTDNELLEGIIIPKKNFSNVYYKKVGARNAQAISKISFVGLCNIEEGKVEEIRIAFGSVGVTVVRDKEFEKKWIGKKVSELITNVSLVLKDYDSIIKPIDDQRSTAFYRKKVCMNLLEDFIKGLK